MAPTAVNSPCSRSTASALQARTRGFTLVEILVALIVVSVGLLGVAGLHAWSLRSNYDALIRSHASALAGDIADRMRANRTAALVAGSDYETTFDEDTREEPETLADDDIIEWKRVLGEQLPQGKGQITVDAASRLVTIQVQWGERDVITEFSTVTEI